MKIFGLRIMLSSTFTRKLEEAKADTRKMSNRVVSELMYRCEVWRQQCLGRKKNA